MHGCLVARRVPANLLRANSAFARPRRPKLSRFRPCCRRSYASFQLRVQQDLDKFKDWMVTNSIKYKRTKAGLAWGIGDAEMLSIIAPLDDFGLNQRSAATLVVQGITAVYNERDLIDESGLHRLQKGIVVNGHQMGTGALKNDGVGIPADRATLFRLAHAILSRPLAKQSSDLDLACVLLIKSLAIAGEHMAVLYYEIISRHRDVPGATKETENTIREHLRTMAKNEDPLAMTVLGQILAYDEQKDELGVKILEKAHLIAKEKIIGSVADETNQIPPASTALALALDELAAVQESALGKFSAKAKDLRAKVREPLETGAFGKGDPYAYYELAKDEYFHRGKGYNSTWLNYTTKAAANGIEAAVRQLAFFYWTKSKDIRAYDKQIASEIEGHEKQDHGGALQMERLQSIKYTHKHISKPINAALGMCLEWNEVLFSHKYADGAEHLATIYRDYGAYLPAIDILVGALEDKEFLFDQSRVDNFPHYEEQRRTLKDLLEECGTASGDPGAVEKARERYKSPLKTNQPHQDPNVNNDPSRSKPPTEKTVIGFGEGIIVIIIIAYLVGVSLDINNNPASARTAAQEMIRNPNSIGYIYVNWRKYRKRWLQDVTPEYLHGVRTYKARMNAISTIR